MSDLPHHQAPPAEEAGSQALADALRSSFFIVKIIMVVLVLAFLGSGFFVVGPQEKAILLRLGRPLGEGEKALLGPGFHWAFPKPVDEVQRIPFTSVQEADSTIGWMVSPEEHRQGVQQPQTGSSLDPASSSYVLSSDTNIIHVIAMMRYRIKDPVRFHLELSNAPVFVTNALNSALLETAGHFTVDDILSRRVGDFQQALTDRVEDLIKSENLGIELQQLTYDPAPPVYLSNKFVEVVGATQRRDTARKEAETYATNTLAAARGTAATRVYIAESASARVVHWADAEAKTFLDVRAEYERDPSFYKRVRQTMALENVYTNVVEKIYIPQGTHELRLNLGREPTGPSTHSVAP